MDLNSKILWFFLALCYCITAPSCRTMKKQMDREKSKSELTEESYSTAKYSYLDTSKRDFSELITYDFKFRDIEFPDQMERNIPINSLNDLIQVEGLMDRVTDLSVKIERVEKEQKGIQLDSSLTEGKKFEEKSSGSSSSTYKESDSTWGANVPWYAWLIGAILIFGIVVYSWKQIKP